MSVGPITSQASPECDGLLTFCDSVLSACAAFRALPDPKETFSFTSLIESPIITTAEAAALLSAIAGACEAHDGNRVSAGPEVVRHVCTAVSFVTDSSSAVEWCRAVRWLSGGVTFFSRCEDNTAAFQAAGGVSSLLGLMDRLVDVEDVSVWGCRTIFALARCIKVDIVTGGGLRYIYAAMSRHGTSAAVQEAACSALQNLTEANTTAVTMMSTGALDRIYTVLTTHSTSPEVVEAAWFALGNLAVNPAYKTIVASTGLQHLYNAMERHSASPGVQEAVCRALCTLAVNDGNSAVIISTGGLDRLYSSMEAHPASVAVQDAAMKTLHNLICDRVNMRPMRAGGADELVEVVQKNHPSQMELCTLCTRLLRRLRGR